MKMGIGRGELGMGDGETRGQGNNPESKIINS